MNELVNVLKKDLEDLDKRLNKKNRDVGNYCYKTESIERITMVRQHLLYDVLKCSKHL